ncbi:XRE family transcriptional regulator [Teredinibacter turnerae]|uniref:XRE family transcriptional regulator n=1 Tax=Teredinibacter turnerae TaxID=2426 RepID=UPI00039A5FA5|nr:XRE family transcriptional regulator [Teredinibacter turnerae]
MNRDDFARWLELDLSRLRNVEQLKAKVNEEEFGKIGSKMPEFLLFLACGGAISLDDLRKSNCPIARLALARIESRTIKIDLLASLRQYLR